MIYYSELNTERLELREIDENSISDLYEIYSDREVIKFYDRSLMESVNEAKKNIDLDKLRRAKGVGCRWGCFFNNELIGTIGFVASNSIHRASVSFDLKRNYWGSGFITEALKEVVKYGLHTLALHRIEAYVLEGNIASSKVLSKCGFVKEGILRDVAYMQGEYKSHIVFSKLSSDC